MKILQQFKNLKYNREKLLNFGFSETTDFFELCRDILDKQMVLTIKIFKNGEIITSIIDKVTNEPYTLHLLPESAGGFVGRVKAEYSAVLEEVAINCFDKNIFKNHQTIKIIEYVRKKYGDELEFLWEKFSNNAIWRRKDNKKWYAAVLTVAKNKLGLESDETVEIIDLRAEDVEKIVDNKKIFKGYHMNKKSWITVILDNSLADEDIFHLIDESYLLANKK